MTSVIAYLIILQSFGLESYPRARLGSTVLGLKSFARSSLISDMNQLSRWDLSIGAVLHTSYKDSGKIIGLFPFLRVTSSN